MKMSETTKMNWNKETEYNNKINQMPIKNYLQIIRHIKPTGKAFHN